jgi:tetratricopeptide (TPR) repeat protein
MNEYMRAKPDDKSITSFYRGIQEKQGTIHFYRGDRFLKEQKYQDALTEFNRAISYCPTAKSMLVSRAKTYTALGKHEQALTDMNEYMRVKPDDKSIMPLYREIQEKKNHLTNIQQPTTKPSTGAKQATPPAVTKPAPSVAAKSTAKTKKKTACRASPERQKKKAEKAARKKEKKEYKRAKHYEYMSRAAVDSQEREVYRELFLECKYAGEILRL